MLKALITGGISKLSLATVCIYLYIRTILKGEREREEEEEKETTTSRIGIELAFLR